MTVGVLLCHVGLESLFMFVGSKNTTEPERRLPPMVIGGIVIPGSLVMYGWTVHYDVQWTVPIIALGILGFGVVVTFIPAFSYLVDAFGIHAASAVAASITIRCITGAVLPLAGPSLYNRLGQGWGNSVLGLIALALLPVPILLITSGKILRQSSRFQVVV